MYYSALTASFLPAVPSVLQQIRLLVFLLTFFLAIAILPCLSTARGMGQNMFIATRRLTYKCYLTG